MKLRLFYLFIMILCAGIVQAQRITVTGRVTDDSGSTIPGASVVLKGTNTGSFTDMDGNYSLNVQMNDTLVFSFIGMETREVRVTGSPTNVQLNSAMIGLEEMVVIGYGSVRRSDLTGSVSSVKMDDMKERGITTLEGFLQGTAAGVQVTSTDGTPGGGMSVRIRGAASINASPEPLYVIDGFPVVSETMEHDAPYGGNFSGTVGGYQSPLASLNPGDIESIEILKDASATAIYGARGANGVVLITTKKGQEGRPRVTYDAYIGQQNVSKKLEMLSQEQYLDIIGQNALGSAWIDTISGMPHDYLYNPDLFINWQDQIFVNGAIQNHSLGISGGTNRSTYNLSLGYLRNEGIIMNSMFERFSTRLNLDNTITDRIKIGARFNTSYTKYSGAFSGGTDGYFAGIIFSALRYRPIFPEQQDIYLDPEFDNPAELGTEDNFAVTNPVIFANELVRRHSRLNNRFDVFAEVDIVKGLKFRSTAGVDLIYNRNTRYYPKTTALGNFHNGRVQEDKQNGFTLLNENTFNYSLRTRNHRVNAVAGFTAQQFTRDGLYIDVSNFPIETNSFYNLSAGLSPQFPVSPYDSWTIASLLARINYTLKNRYLFTASYRRDGSSRFGAANKWAGFPSLAIAWNAHQEKFMDQFTFINELKLRTSYGITGNQNIARYSSLASTATEYYPFSGSTQLAITDAQMANANLKWETTIQSNLGLDIGLLNDRINITFDWYKKSTKDLLLNAVVPATTGHTRVLQNIGAIEQSGTEFSFSGCPISTSNFSWNIGFNVSWANNKVLDLGDTDEIIVGGGGGYQIHVIRVGQPLGMFYGLIWNGIYQLEDFDYDENLPHELRNYKLKEGVAYSVGHMSNQLPGDPKFVDISGPEGVPDGVIDAYDRHVIGNANPKHIGGITNNFRYNNFDLRVFMNWSYGNQVYNWQTFRLGMPKQNTTMNYLSSVANYWTPDNPTNDMPALNAGTTGRNIRDLSTGNSFMIEDASFLRLASVVLGYKIPGQILSMAGISSIRVYVSAENLYVWTNYSGYDPEVSMGRNPLNPGVDSNPYPRSKTYMLGVNVNF